MALIAAMLALWLLLVLVGLAVKAVVWFAVLGAILFLIAIVSAQWGGPRKPPRSP